MTEINLYCAETPGLKLGPGTLNPLDTTSQTGGTPASSSEVIMFADGFASFDDKRFPKWREWMNHPGTPHIDVIDAAEGLVPLRDSDFACAICAQTENPKAFGTSRQLAGHMMSHRAR